MEIHWSLHQPAGDLHCRHILPVSGVWRLLRLSPGKGEYCQFFIVLIFWFVRKPAGDMLVFLFSLFSKLQQQSCNQSNKILDCLTNINNRIKLSTSIFTSQQKSFWPSIIQCTFYYLTRCHVKYTWLLIFTWVSCIRDGASHQACIVLEDNIDHPHPNSSHQGLFTKTCHYWFINLYKIVKGV